jgi:hypothetical protein
MNESPREIKRYLRSENAIYAGAKNEVPYVFI